MKHKICVVEEESIADQLGVESGDFLLTIDGSTIIDVLDYRFRMHSANLLVEIEKTNGEIWELDIEKNESADLGLFFESPLMSNVKLCTNKCIFCFVDQEPPGLRKTLYVKDDDWRLSFLHGNFITLTNMSGEEAVRISDLHISPLNISVHTADLDLRRSMMGSDRADNLFHLLRLFSDAGIRMNFQIVLCKNINDGKTLNYTINKLANLPGASSLAVVPVGLTRYRRELTSIESFSPDDAIKIISQVEALQEIFLRVKKSSFVFLSDEWYIMIGTELPALYKYEDFPQLSNGVGMIRLFEYEFMNELMNLPSTDASKSVFIITGTLSVHFMRHVSKLFCNKFKNVLISVIEIKNNFYGETVTVSGLLSGSDILCQLSRINLGSSALFLPQNAFRASSEEMIDGITRFQLEDSLGTRVLIGNSNGGCFARQLYEEIIC